MDYISLDEGVALYAGSEDDMYSAFNGTRPGSPHIIAGPLTVFFNTNGYSPLSPTDGFKMRYMIIPNTIGKYIFIMCIIFYFCLNSIIYL